MNYFTYNLLMYLSSPIIWCYLIWRAIGSKDYREGFAQRLGIIPEQKSLQRVLIHCASVGESKAAIPLIKRILSDFPHFELVITNTTPTGKQVILDTFGGSVQQFYLPIDWRGSVERFIKALSPKLVVIMETELWPNLLKSTKQCGIPLILANARLSEKSHQKYSKKLAFSKSLFGSFNQIAAQYESDAKRILSLVDDKKRVITCGNIKFDMTLSPEVIEQQAYLRTTIKKDRRVWVAASIHPGEFEFILNAHRQLLKNYPDLLLVGIPRHPEKFVEFEEMVKNHSLSFVCRSTDESVTIDTQVLVGDTMGEVTHFCGIADSVFIGGSLVDYGGHNPLEAIVCGVPVVMGPSTYSFDDICQKLLLRECMLRSNGGDELVECLKVYLEDREKLKSFKLRATQVMNENQGCVDRLITIIDDNLR